MVDFAYDSMILCMNELVNDEGLPPKNLAQKLGGKYEFQIYSLRREEGLGKLRFLVRLVAVRCSQEEPITEEVFLFLETRTIRWLKRDCKRKFFIDGNAYDVKRTSLFQKHNALEWRTADNMYIFTVCKYFHDHQPSKADFQKFLKKSARNLARNGSFSPPSNKFLSRYVEKLWDFLGKDYFSEQKNIIFLP